MPWRKMMRLRGGTVVVVEVVAAVMVGVWNGGTDVDISLCLLRERQR